MRRHRLRKIVLVLAASTLMPAAAFANDFEWAVVVNNDAIVPGDSLGRRFNSYNQPSVNVGGLVVFRARSRGGGGMGTPTAHGVYARDIAQGGPVVRVFDRNTLVPMPNNLETRFTEPPSFPRIDMWSSTIASRANHRPVWRYMIAPDAETRVGTNGIYVQLLGDLITGASGVGAVPGFEFFAVPETAWIRFDVFPGAPAVTDGATIVFKGNHTLDDETRTGVYYRDLRPGPAGGDTPVVPIADNIVSVIPGTSTVFGSTAPPSAAYRTAVFAGFDNEDAPTLGGIYSAPLAEPYPPLVHLVGIGSSVPGEKEGVVFNRLGEGVSFDGRFVAFWGAWGSETRSLTLHCRDEGNRARVEYCHELYPDGFQTEVPVHQGIFVHDTRNGQTRTVAKSPIDFDDFLFWNFSGRVPGSEDESDGELARWRSAAFVAVSGLVDGRLNDATYHVAFKARNGQVDDDGETVSPVDGIYLRRGPGLSRITALVETGMRGTLFDPQAVDSATGTDLAVTEMGIERDGFRGDLLVVNVRMGTEEAGWAGIYLTVIP